MPTKYEITEYYVLLEHNSICVSVNLVPYENVESSAQRKIIFTDFINIYNDLILNIEMMLNYGRALTGDSVLFVDNPLLSLLYTVPSVDCRLLQVQL